MPVSVTVKKKYRDFLLDVSFESKSHRIGILGASGCGKSLTLKSIAGLVKPDAGYILADGNVLFDSANKTDIKPQNRNVGYLFQEYALFPNMTVEENIAISIAHSKRFASRPDDISGILERFGLLDVRDHHPGELSGGQKQRCALARMLAGRPDMLLLDEPFSAMDTFLREGMRLELIKILDEYDRTAIMVSHDRDELYQMCDHLIVMEGGRVIAQGETEDVFKNPGTIGVARLTGCKNISRIERIGRSRVIALDWDNIELETGREVGDEISHIGIRAHDFIPGEHGENIISCGNTVTSGLPFEWYVTLENGLWWKYPKEIGDKYTKDMIPENVSVLPDKIILLKSGQN